MSGSDAVTVANESNRFVGSDLPFVCAGPYGEPHSNQYPHPGERLSSRRRPRLKGDLIYDVGFHNGDDTAYYLHRGFRVVAVEANPNLAALGGRRFETEIADRRLVLLNVGIAQTEGTFSFWVNDDNDTWSSFDRSLAGRNGTRNHEVQIRGVTFSSILGEYGTPYYMKVDIEGSDALCLPALDRNDPPKYISCELEQHSDIVSKLYATGYRRFKVLNQTTYTESTPIFESEIAARFLRKVCYKLPAVRSAVHHLPASLRPKKIAFDNHLSGFTYQFNEGCSGPFGEDTYGSWHSFEGISKWIARIERQHQKAGGLLKHWWYDVHATW